jgi:hypothetical protein
MALPGVTINIKDGAMGVMGASATGYFAAVGVASRFGQGLLTFTDPSQVEAALGDGPLRDLIVSALSIARTTVYAIALEGSVPGTLSSVAPGSANTGTGTVAAVGTPRNEYDVAVEIRASGMLNEAVFRVVVDGLPGKQITVPDDGLYIIPGTGITLTFAAGENGFVEGDSFTFSATEPQATNGEVLAAINQLLNAKLTIEWIAVAGISSTPLWSALATYGGVFQSRAAQSACGQS